MPEAMLKFKLPAEQVEFQSAIKAMEYREALWSFYEKLRSHIKYDINTSEQQSLLEKLRVEFHECLGDLDIT